jgi:CRISPR/Cas system CMR subunit Cmr6 (Cas7 group RAMP superfamily)
MEEYLMDKMRLFVCFFVIAPTISLSVSVAQAQSYWSSWATNNPNEDLTHTIYCPSGRYVIGLEAKEESGYGLVDVRLICSSNYYTDWATHNPNPAYFRTIQASSATYGLEVDEEHGYGVIDARLQYGTQWSRFTPWLTNNPNEDLTHFIQCNYPYFIAGLQVKEEHGYGIIDFRMLCSRE